jgi:restriction system protein
VTAAVEIPKYYQFHWPIIVAFRELGDSATIEELNSRVITDGGYTEDQQAVLHHDGPNTEIEYRLAWGRTYLKGMGLATNSARSVWNLTDQGRTVTESELEPLRKEYLSRARKAGSRASAAGPGAEDEAESESRWQEQLLDEIMKLDPSDFERLAQRLLREEGFINTQVTGRSSDGGIDGQGVYRLSLLSFQVYFQCKRYSGSVGSGAARGFRGAMAGRGDKGLLITTGTFTTDAKAEATRDGAPPIDLIDGARLCDLLKIHRMGVVVRERIEEDVSVDAELFSRGF